MSSCKNKHYFQTIKVFIENMIIKNIIKYNSITSKNRPRITADPVLVWDLYPLNFRFWKLSTEEQYQQNVDNPIVYLILVRTRGSVKNVGSAKKR